MIYATLRMLTRAAASTFLPGLLRVEGHERVPISGSLLVCTNHVSTIDPVMVPAFLPRADSWSLGKSEYFEPGARFGWLFRAYHGFPIVRHSPDRAALRRAVSILRRGEALCIYPEGTRRGDLGLLRPEPGAGFLALATEATVLPVAISGTQDVYGKDAKLPRQAPVTIAFGPPFRLRRTHSDGSRVTYQEAADAIMLEIATLLPARLRGEFADVAAWELRVDDLAQHLDHDALGPRVSAVSG